MELFSKNEANTTFIKLLLTKNGRKRILLLRLIVLYTNIIFVE